MDLSNLDMTSKEDKKRSLKNYVILTGGSVEGTRNVAKFLDYIGVTFAVKRDTSISWNSFYWDEDNNNWGVTDFPSNTAGTVPQITLSDALRMWDDGSLLDGTRTEGDDTEIPHYDCPDLFFNGHRNSCVNYSPDPKDEAAKGVWGIRRIKHLWEGYDEEP